MNQINKPQQIGLRAALILAGACAFGIASADPVTAVVGGDRVSGDQATLLLDSTNPTAFAYQRDGSGLAGATAYFTSQLFCAETPRSVTQAALLPRYQSASADVWHLPDVYMPNATYAPSGFGGTGAHQLKIGESLNLVGKKYRCLSANARSNGEAWHAHHGLLDSNAGDYIGTASAVGTPPAQDPPSVPHQNVKVEAENFAGFTGRVVSVVRVEMAFDGTSPADAEWTLLDGINTSALSVLVDAEWCLLRSDWVEGTTPPVNLCLDSTIIRPGFTRQTGEFVRQPVAFTVANPGPQYVLVSRQVSGAPAAGEAIQGFAALLTAGGMAGQPEEMQDWFADDSVWFNY